MGWLRIKATRRLVEGWVRAGFEDSCQRGLPHSHMRFAPMEMMENRLVPLKTALRIRGIGTGWLAAHADTGVLQGIRVARLEKKDGDGVAAAAPITARCRVRAWAGWGKGNWVGVGGIGEVAVSGVAGGKGWSWVRASPAAILSGLGSRDRLGSRVLMGVDERRWALSGPAAGLETVPCSVQWW